MQETVRSLRAYLVVAAVLQGLSSVPILFHAGVPVLALLVGVIGGVFALAYLYLGVRLRSLLTDAPSRVIGVLYGGAAFQVLVFLLFAALSGIHGAEVATLGIGLLIIWYLIGNVRRLAATPEFVVTRKP